MIAQRPSIFIYTKRANPEYIKQICAGIEEEGVLVTTVNATQEFIKANPALGEMQKINAQLLNIEKSFGFDDESTVTERVSLT